MKPTAAMEDYLEALLVLEQKNIETRVKNLAEELNIKPPSVIEMIKSLISKKLVSQKPRENIKLTSTGREIAKKIQTRHLAIKDFFQHILGMDEAFADSEACKVEHCLSTETCDKLIEYMASL
ncbi:MAG: metal-dependent transcriptional regulator [Candidatus Margulisbacteria bacterium]|nr:metal-dependent transcriptional regulator [Candidatus Margulisiibacteriota bacterium]